MKRIALATSKALPRLAEDDRRLQRWLIDAGAEATATVWTDSLEWDAFDAVLIRSCWDYHLRPQAFRSWIERLEDAAVRLFNPAVLLRWNLEKTYLRELEARGIPVVPTVWLSPPGATLDSALEQHGWQRAVVKPTLSATAHRTWITTRALARGHQPAVDALLREGGVMVQEFRQEILEEGEWSFIYFAGRFSHAVLKQAKSGDFRVQEEFEGSAQARWPPAKLLQQAHNVIERVQASVAHGSELDGVVPLYARVDGIRDASGALLLMELELIEPALYLANDPSAVERFGTALLSAMGSSSDFTAR